MAIPSIFDNMRMPQMSYNWEIEFLSSFFGTTNESLKYYAINVNTPTRSVDQIKRYYAGRQYNIPLKDSSPNILSVTFWDNEDLEIYTTFLAWHGLLNNTEFDLDLFKRAKNLRAKTIGDTRLDPRELGKSFYDFIAKKNAVESFVRGAGSFETLQKGAKPSDYLMDCKVKMLKSDHSSGLTHKYTGCFVSEIGDATLSYSDSRPFEFDVRISFNESTVED